MSAKVMVALRVPQEVIDRIQAELNRREAHSTLSPLTRTEWMLNAFEEVLGKRERRKKSADKKRSTKVAQTYAED